MDLPPEPVTTGTSARDDQPREPVPAGAAERSAGDPEPPVGGQESVEREAPDAGEAAAGSVAPAVSVDEPEALTAESAEPEALTAESSEPAAESAEPAAESAEPAAESSEPAPPAASGADEVVSMGELLDEGEYLPEAFERGDTVKGVVVRKAPDQLILDVGTKREGIVPASDLAKLPSGMLAGIQVGDEVEVVVVRRPTGDGELLVSINQALSRQDWVNAKEAMESGELMEMKVSGYNRGGVLVDFGALQGFVPKSHLVSLSKTPADLQPVERFRQMVGLVIPCKVVEVNQKQRRLIMSERRAVREWRATHKRDLLADLHEGDVRTGTVSSVADFGVFVDLGGGDGLVHVSELTHERGRHPKEVVKIGQSVEVYVLSLDREKKRIGLSMKRLQPDPWSKVEDDHYIGQICDAGITNLSKFGAFARLPSGLEGLIHLSEISDDVLESPGDAVQPGQEVTVEILSIDPERQRIGLSMRRVPEHLRTAHPEPAGSDSDQASAGAGASPFSTDEAVADDESAPADVHHVPVAVDGENPVVDGNNDTGADDGEAAPSRSTDGSTEADL